MTQFLPIAANIDVSAKVFDNAYQSSNNMMESASRVITGQCQKLSLPSKSFGNVVTVDLPQNMLLGHVIMTLKIPKNQVPKNAFLTKGWGYSRAIRYVEYSFADSEKLRYEAKHILIKTLSDAESGEKKDLIMSLGGDEKLASVAPAGLVGHYVAQVAIYLPFSNVNSAKVIPYDSSILSRPIQLNIELARADQVFSYSTADAPVVIPALNFDYSDAYVMTKTQFMVDGPSDSIKQMVSLNGTEKYTYGYIYPQTYTDSQDRVGVRASEPGNQRVQVRLERFLNASLQSIDCFLERRTLGTTPDQPLSNSVWGYNQYVRMTNVQLIFAGQCIWRSDDSSDLLMNISEYPTSTTFNTNSYPYNAATNDLIGALVPDSKKGYWVHIQLSQFHESFMHSLIQSGVSLTSNQVLLEFTTPELDDPDLKYLPQGGVPTEPVQDPEYRLFAIYNYQASVRQAKGTASLTFQPPLASLPSISGIAGTF